MHLCTYSNLFVRAFKFYFIYFMLCEQSLPVNIKDGIFFKWTFFCHSVGQADAKKGGLCCFSPITVEHWRLFQLEILHFFCLLLRISERIRNCYCIKSTLISDNCLQAIEGQMLSDWLVNTCHLYVPPHQLLARESCLVAWGRTLIHQEVRGIKDVVKTECLQIWRGEVLE